MLPDDPTRTAQATSAKIIPLRPLREERYPEHAREVARGRLAAQFSALGRRVRSSREDAARHYLKFMLPFIPILVFIMTFLYSWVLVGMHTVVLNGHASEASYTTPVDPTLPLIGALLLSVATGILCMAIYAGYVRNSQSGL